MKKILISDNLSDAGLDILKSYDDFEVDIKTGLTPDQLKEEITGYDAIIVRSGTKLTSDIIEKADNMKVIGRAGVGLDNIDVESASKKGIVVMNAPGGNTVSTAEHTMSLILALSRNITQAVLSVKQGEWNRKKFMGNQLYGKNIGIIGLGRIGSEIAKRCNAFGMKVNAYDPFLSSEKAEELGIKLVDFDTILRESDYITVHTPLTKDTEHMIGNNELKKMKDNARIINCARGGIIDESALEKVVKSGKIAGVALDVYEIKPQEGNALLKYDNVIGTPHLGASTEEAQKEVAIEIAKQVADALNDKGLRNAINVPSVDVESYKSLEPYINLAEKIGLFQGQLLNGRINKVVVKYSGEVAKQTSTVITIAVIKGLLTPIIGGGSINYVNASMIAQERNIKVIEAKTSQMEDYTNLITVEVNTDKAKTVVVGTLFTRKNPRIVKINDYIVEAVPDGYVLYNSYKDIPGVLGRIGTILGESGINIASMNCGRDKPKGKAVSILNVDSIVSHEILGKIKSSKDIFETKLIKF